MCRLPGSTKFFFATLASGLLLFTLLDERAWSQTESGEISFDDVEEQAPQTRGWYDRVHFSGRYDFNLEMENFNGGDSRDRFRNYHRFLFIKVKATEDISLTAEVLDQSYYELAYRLSPRTTLRAGRIWVPFGLTPFHHFYGGVQGDPFEGLMVPNVWAELGVAIEYSLLPKESSSLLTGDTFVIRGFDGTAGQVLATSQGGKDDQFALGQRIVWSLYSHKLVVSGAMLYNQWGPANDNDVLLWGFDAQSGYGLIDRAVFRDMTLRGGFARADISDGALVSSAVNSDGGYYKYGDFVQVTYGRFRPELTFTARAGSYIDFDDVVTSNDSHTFMLGATHRRGPLSFMGQFFWQLEEVNEIDNDFLRLQMVLEF